MKITEDYVSFEVAKLLKEKGFDWDCQYCYIDEDDSDKEQLEVPTGYDAEIEAPTLQMAYKWLREVHNLWIALFKDADYGWKYKPQSMTVSGEERFVGSPFTGYYSTYEEACEAAIKYCLENLI